MKDVSILPEGIKGQRIQSLIKAMNSNDPEVISRFVKENFSERFLNAVPMEEHVNIALGIYDRTGGFSGINSNLDVFVESGYIVAVMSNIDMGASPLARKIRELILNMR